MDLSKPTHMDITYDKKGNKEYIIDNAYLQWFNLAGRENPNNRKGKRNLVWRIPDPEWAEELAADGYNVKHYSVRDGYDGDEYDYLQIQLTYRDKDGVPFAEKYPGLVPHVYLVDEDDYYTLIDEDGVGEFDDKTILYALLEFRRYDWDYNRKKGTTACIKNLYLKVKKDPIVGRFKPKEAVHPNDYSVMKSQMDKERNQKPNDGDDLPFNI